MIKNSRFKNYTLALVVALNFVVQPSSAGLLDLRGIGMLSTAKLEARGFKSVEPLWDHTTGSMTYAFRDKAGQIAGRIAYANTGTSAQRMATIESLKQFSPSSLEKYLHALKTESKTITVTKLKHFPTEAFSFFVALGALQVQQMVFNYYKNPAGYDQLIDSQLSPLGQVSFAAFMVANGLVAEPLMAAVKSKTLRGFIPYLGMAAGSMASNIVHEVGAIIPNFVGCGAKMGLSKMTPVDLKICDTAFEEWAKFNFSEKGHQFMATLASMIISTFAAGVGEKILMTGVETTAAVTKKSLVRMVAIEMMMTASPAGWGVRGGRWIYKIGQLAAFTWIDHQTIGPVTQNYKSWVWGQVGDQLKQSNQLLGNLVTQKQLNLFQPLDRIALQGKRQCLHLADKENCVRDLDLELEHFAQSMADWRKVHMDDVITTHNNWQNALFQISSQYRVAKQFYLDFVSDLSTRKGQRVSAPNHVHLMDRKLPYFGVTPDDMTDDEISKLMMAPTEIETRQKATLAKLIASPNFEVTAADIKKFNKADLETLAQIQTALKSSDDEAVALGFMKLRKVLGRDPGEGAVIIAGQALKDWAAAVFKALGNPDPKMKPGQGYLALMANNPASVIYHQNPFSQMIGASRFRTVTEYLSAQMLFGPEPTKGEALSTSSIPFGYMNRFSPPRLRTDSEFSTQIGKIKDHVVPGLFEMTFKQKSVSGEASIPVFAFLKDYGIRPEILGDDQGSKILDYWTQYAESDFSKAWLAYEEEYQKVIGMLHYRLFDTGGSGLNASPFSKGLLGSMEQERNIYLYVLEKLVLSLGEDQKASVHALPGLDEPRSMELGVRQNPVSQLPWFVRQNKVWQDVKEQLGLIQKFTITESGKNQSVLISGLDSDKFEKALARLATKSSIHSLPYNLAQVFLPTDQELMNCPEGQQHADPKLKLIVCNKHAYIKKIALTALTGLEKVQQELKTYVQIIDSVSYTKTFEGRDLDKAAKKRCLARLSSMVTAAQRAAMGCE